MARAIAQDTVAALFSSRAQVEAALEELQDLGLTDQDLGIAVPDALYHGLGAEQQAADRDSMGQAELKGAAAGFILGAPLGSLAGVALAAIAVGGLGPLGVGGMLAGAGAGAVWGMFLGGEAGLLAKIHSEEEEPHWSAIPLSHTDILVLVRPGTRLADVHDVVMRHGGHCFCALDRPEE